MARAGLSGTPLCVRFRGPLQFSPSAGSRSKNDHKLGYVVARKLRGLLLATASSSINPLLSRVSSPFVMAFLMTAFFFFFFLFSVSYIFLVSPSSFLSFHPPLAFLSLLPVRELVPAHDCHPDPGLDAVPFIFLPPFFVSPTPSAAGRRPTRAQHPFRTWSLTGFDQLSLGAGF